MTQTTEPLRALLRRLGITQTDWAAAIRLSDGRSLSRATAYRVLTDGAIPRRITPRELIDQTRRYLASRGVPDDDLPTLAAIRIEAPAGATQPAHPVSIIAQQTPEIEMLSQHARKKFGLFSDPFRSEIHKEEDVFTSPDVRYIRDAMYFTARHGGLLAVVGESGSGKSVLRRDLLARIQRTNDSVIVIQPGIIDKGKVTASSISDAIIYDLDGPRARVPRTLERKARRIHELLLGSHQAGNSHVLIIEEAHDLTTPVIKQLKRFWELEAGYTHLLGIILLGQPEIYELLDLSRNWQAREFINRCEIAHISALDAHLEEYLSLKFGRAGKPVEGIIADDAYPAIREKLSVTGGSAHRSESSSILYPLLVNNLVTRAMNLCADIGQDRVDASIIREV